MRPSGVELLLPSVEVDPPHRFQALGIGPMFVRTVALLFGPTPARSGGPRKAVEDNGQDQVETMGPASPRDGVGPPAHTAGSTPGDRFYRLQQEPAGDLRRGYK